MKRTTFFIGLLYMLFNIKHYLCAIIQIINNTMVNEDYNKVQQVLKTHDVWCEISDLSLTDDKVIIHIEWGDWKHSHARLDYVMKHYLGYTLIKEEVTEEDGSDTYSSVHYYTKSGLNDFIK